MTWYHRYLRSFLLWQLGLCCPAAFLYAFTGWCWHKNCSSLMFRTKSSHLSDVEFLNSSFNNTISQAGDLGWMSPLDSIQSTPHLFWYNYLHALRFIAVVGRGMRLNACSVLHRKRNQHIYKVRSSINCYWNNLGMNKNLWLSLKWDICGSMHIFYISTLSIYPKRFQTTTFVRCGVFHKN